MRSFRTGGSPRETRDAEFIAGNAEGTFSIHPVPIRERTALNVPGDYLVCLAHRVGAELGKTPLHDRLVFLCSSRHAIVGREFGKIRTGEDLRKMAVSVVGQLAPRIGTIKIGLFVVLLKRDGNERPRSHKILNVWATASSLGKNTPKISTDAVTKGKMRRFMALLVMTGGD